MDPMTSVLIAIACGGVLLLIMGFLLEKFGPVGGRSKQPPRDDSEKKAAQAKR